MTLDTELETSVSQKQWKDDLASWDTWNEDVKILVQALHIVYSIKTGGMKSEVRQGPSA